MLNRVPSFEFIALQDERFFNELKTAIKTIRRDPKYGTKTVVESNIETLIQKRFGFNVIFEIEKAPWPNAYAINPPIDSNHIFSRTIRPYSNQAAGEVIMLFDKRDNRIGNVDTEEVRVSGVYSNIPVKIGITHGLLHEIFTDEEIVAVLLHELGHIYTYFYYLHVTAMGSFISLSTAAAAMGAKSDRDKISIIEKGARILGLDGVAVRELVDQNEEQLNNSLQTLYINQTKSNLRSETGYGIYELKACEQLADWFMSKFHPRAALSQATALEKMYRHDTKITVDTYYNSGIYFAKLGALTALAAGYGKKVKNNLVVNALIYNDTVDIYDKPSDRVAMLRNNVIDSLKDVKLSPATMKELIRSADSLKPIINSMKEFDETPNAFIKFIRGVVIKDYRNNLNAIKLQKNIEALMYSEAYLHAAKLRGLDK